MVSSTAPGHITPSPSTKRSHASTRKPSIQEPSTSSVSAISISGAHSNMLSILSRHSTFSNSSHARSPRQKKPTSIRTDMAHLALSGAESNTSSVSSDLGDRLYCPPSPITAEDLIWSESGPFPTNTSPSHDLMQCNPQSTDNALPDLNTQYKSPSESDGGAPSQWHLSSLLLPAAGGPLALINLPLCLDNLPSQSVLAAHVLPSHKTPTPQLLRRV